MAGGLTPWTQWSPTTQRLATVSGIVASGLGVIGLIAGLTPEPTLRADKQQVVKHILTDSDPRSLGIDGLATQLKQIGQKHDDLLRRLSGLEEEQKRVRLSDEERLRRYNEEQASSHQGQIEALRSEIDTLRRARETTATTPESTTPPRAAREPAVRPPTRTPSPPDLDALFAQPPAPTPYATGTGTPSATPGPNSSKTRLEIRLIKPTAPEASAPGQETPSAAGKAPPSIELFIPAGSILSGRLLNGLDAPTGKGARKEPFPVLVRLKDEAILPNRFRADVRECFVVSAGYGDLSSERAYLRGESISCIRDDGGVIEVPLDAYAVGEDGKVGVRGRVVSKQGQLLGNALLAGFLRGFSDAFGRNQTQVLALTGPAGVAATPFQRSFSESAMEGGTLKGAGYAMERLAHYYLDLAENLFPVIEIDATRPVEFIVQRGTPLKLASH